MKRRLDDYLDKGAKKTIKKAKDYESSDIEQIAKVVAEKTVALLTKGLLEELEKLRKDIDNLRNDVLELKKEIELLRKASKIKEFSIRKNFDISKEFKEKLEDFGYILASEARSELNLSISVFKRIASRLENVDIIESGGDIVVINKNAFKDFKNRLNKVKTSDPIEASKNLGKYDKLFLTLRKGGLLIYDSKAGWRLLEY